MPAILAHRGNTHGPSPAHENRLGGIERALARGWGLEIDIRRDRDGHFYIAHDAKASAAGFEADAICAAIRRYPRATVALNIKELGYEAALLEFLTEQQILRQCFLFDMELVERTPGRTARLLRALHPHVQIAARVSDRGESLTRALAIDAASVIWLDEFDSPWASERDVRSLKAAGWTVYAVSPDLHQYPMAAARSRWVDFARWGVDGICTDYPNELAGLLAPSREGVAV